MITKKFYLRDKSEAISELQFDSFGLATQVAKAMAQTYPIGNYSKMYVVDGKTNRAQLMVEGNNTVFWPKYSPNRPEWPGDAF